MLFQHLQPGWNPQYKEAEPMASQRGLTFHSRSSSSIELGIRASSLDEDKQAKCDARFARQALRKPGISTPAEVAVPLPTPILEIQPSNGKNRVFWTWRVSQADSAWSSFGWELKAIRRRSTCIFKDGPRGRGWRVDLYWRFAQASSAA